MIMLPQRALDQLDARAVLRAKEVDRVLKHCQQRQLEYYIGGSSLAGNDYSDIDIFPTTEGQLRAWRDIDHYTWRTPNATTFEYDGSTVQLCNYYQEDLEHLVDSFDFAHIQIGACIVADEVVDLEVHPNFVAARLTGTTWYTGSKFPLASLTRLAKYAQRNNPPVLARESALGIANDLAYLYATVTEDEWQAQLNGIDLPPDSRRRDLLRLGRMLWLEIQRGRRT